MGYPGVRQALSKHCDEPIILAQHVGLYRIRAGPRDQRGDVDAGVVGVGEQQWHHDSVAGAPGQHVAEIRKVLLAEGHPDVDAATQQADGVRHFMCRCRRTRIGTSVRHQYQSHEACKPHSVFVEPAHRPLRGSAPSTGFVVHGAQPIDG